MPWLFVINRDFLLDHNLLFDVQISHQEDTIWRFLYILNRGTVKYSSNVVYGYRQRPTSAMNTKSHEMSKKYNKSLYRMLEIYAEVYKKYPHDELDSIIPNFKEAKIYASSANILFSELRLQERSPKDVITDLKSIEAYPYPMLLSRLSLKYSIATFLVNLFSLGFCYDWYYIAAYNLYGFLKQIKSR